MSGLTMKYFVLKPRGEDVYAIASRRALLTYAACIGAENGALCNDLVAWVKEETNRATGEHENEQN